jgi:hypothetical protein
MPAEYDHHKALMDFDWHGAIRMMSDSVARSCGQSVQVLTDVDTDLPFDCLKYVTTHRRLMLWYLEIAAVYLASDDFDRDTIALDSDQLVFGDLARWFAPLMDLGILARPLPPKDPEGFTILNGVQLWSHRAKPALAAFYRQALALAETLPEDVIAWGADTVALQMLLDPVVDYLGAIVPRAGLRVRLLAADDVLERLSSTQIRHLQSGERITRTRDVLDFRNMRKRFMKEFYAATFAADRVVA